MQGRPTQALGGRQCRYEREKTRLAPLLVHLGLLVAPLCESGEPVNFSASRGTNESTGLIVTTMERAHTYLRVTAHPPPLTVRATLGVDTGPPHTKPRHREGVT